MAYIIDDEVPYQDPHSRGTGSIVTQHVVVACECPEHGRFEACFAQDWVPDVMLCQSPCEDGKCRKALPVIMRRPGFITRTRGEHNRLVRHDYECPVHGVFEALVPSGKVPAKVGCLDMTEVAPGAWSGCGRPSPYRVPVVGQGIAAGSVKC